MGFCMFTAGYAMLSAVKTIDRYRIKMRQQNQVKPMEAAPEMSEEKKDKIKRRKLIKTIINYCVSFNSAFLIVGSLSESYLYGVRMTINIVSVTIGYIYAFFIVQPFMYSLDDGIKTPYQYFEKRYRTPLARSISSFVGMIFYFCFLTLYLWGSTVLLSTLVPQIPYWLSSIIIGVYSVIGSTIGGFTQTTITNVTQFLILISGLIAAIVITVQSSKNSFQELWHFAELNNRTTFFDLRVDLRIRYKMLNQVTSLPIPWCAIHALLLPNFMRYRSVKGVRKSRYLMISNFPFMFFVNMLILMAGGILCFLYFYGCDPLKAKKIPNKNGAGPYWLYLVLSKHAPSYCGILFSSIICYSVVQHSMGMALCSHTIFEETLNPLISLKVKISEAVSKKIKLFITVSLGIGSILLAISMEFAKNTMLALFFLFNNSTNSPILGLFLLSAFNPYANGFGALTGFVSNLCINYWLGSGSLIFSNLKKQEFAYDTNLCQVKNHNTNFSSFDFNLHAAAMINNTMFQDVIPLPTLKNETVHYYPENPVLFYLYSIAPIWYCLFSVLYTFSMGSLLSLIYSLVKTRTIDADAAHSEDRKNYLFYHRMKTLKLYNLF